ncbi:velvet factor-domain-containing protein [Obelidium mucronatum]|nr:velvet factor-domain-containing protein [Obelidium mucronatum]
METNHSISTKSGAPLAYIPIPPDGSEPASLPTPASSSTTLNDNIAAEKPKTNYSVIITDSYARSFILIGSIISECHTLTDTENADGLFFVFHDLAVRTTGSYRLKFEMYDTKSSKKGEGMTPIAEVVSDAFQVYRPADFPGLSETTELSRCFARQGIQIRMKYAN